MKEKAADVLIYSGFGERRAQYELSYRRHKAFRISINTETRPLKKKVLIKSKRKVGIFM